MTPEELAEARHYAACYQVGYVHSLMHSLLDHIDQQAARIAALEAQVAALREIARGERAGFLHYRASCYDPGRRCPYAKGCDDCTGWDTCSALDRFNADAIRQLSEKHPEAFQ